MKFLFTLCCILFAVCLSSAVVRSAPLIALTESNKLLRIETTAPEFIQGQTTVTGLQPGEKLLAIDFRPSTGRLYGVTDSSRLYVINPAGAATQMGSGSFSPALNLGGIQGLDLLQRRSDPLGICSEVRRQDKRPVCRRLDF